MSMYNAIFGTNPLMPVILIALQTSPREIGRFRDAYLTPEGNFAILTRTGGGNRPDYEKENAYLHTLPGYVSDQDMAFDSTYAVFTYSVPDILKESIDEMVKRGYTWDPVAAWKKLHEDLQAGRDSPEVARAKKVGEEITKAIEANPEGGTIEI